MVSGAVPPPVVKFEPVTVTVHPATSPERASVTVTPPSWAVNPPLAIEVPAESSAAAGTLIDSPPPVSASSGAVVEVVEVEVPPGSVVVVVVVPPDAVVVVVVGRVTVVEVGV